LKMGLRKTTATTSEVCAWVLVRVCWTKYAPSY
jgi:hypothetical protein